MKPLRVTTRDGEFLENELAEISFEGGSVIAAHQYLRARKETGWLDDKGLPRIPRKDEFIELGKAIIHRFINSKPVLKS